MRGRSRRHLFLCVIAKCFWRCCRSFCSGKNSPSPMPPRNEVAGEVSWWLHMMCIEIFKCQLFCGLELCFPLTSCSSEAKETLYPVLYDLVFLVWLADGSWEAIIVHSSPFLRWLGAEMKGHYCHHPVGVGKEEHFMSQRRKFTKWQWVVTLCLRRIYSAFFSFSIWPFRWLL